MRYLGHSLAIAAALAAVGVSAPAAFAQAASQAASVIVLNYEQLVRTSIAGRDLQAKLQQIRTAAEQELQPEANSIEQERQRIGQASQGMSEEQIRANSALVGQIQALSQRAEAWQQRRQNLARDIQCTEQVAVAHFNEAITPTVRQVMTERGAGIVIDRQAANLVIADYDATARVLALIDQSVRTVDVARTPAATCEPQQAAAAPAPAPAPQQGRRRNRNN
jgi:Skp family chaperone for outer membrane proteins